METDRQLAPSVVSVMVVHAPGDWFEDTLASLAAQDYTNLRTLFLLTDRNEQRADDTAARITAVLPDAFVRPVPTASGFGDAANEVLRLVEGDNGFFLICHDDIVLAPDAVRLLVTELFRSNAGIVGPKLVDWDEPRLLQHVGLGLDRFGEVDSIIEPGEYDQEQHDAVRDVFVLPSACLLVRADLFRTLGGFDPAITFHGEDVDLCWRTHHTGARVIVAPDAVVKHRERLTERRPDLAHRTLRARHRMRAVATLTGASRLLGRSIQLVLLTIVELFVGLFSGRLGEALASVRALFGMLVRTPGVIRRRRAIAGQRMVHEREVLSLQEPGSARLTSYLRGKETTTFVGAETTVRRWREASFGPPLAWFLVVVAVLVGSRGFITGGVPTVGEFLPLPDSPRSLLSEYQESFDGRGFGAAAATPTGWVVVGFGSVLTLFRMAALMTWSVIGLYLLGALGAWRLVTVFPVNRARIAGMVVYVATPLVPGLFGRGDLSALVWFAALPWLAHLVRRSAGLAAADPHVDLDLSDGVAMIGWRERLRSLAFLSIVLALAAAFVPVVIGLWVVVGVLLAGATLVALGSWRVTLWLLAATVVSALVAVVLNLPWALEWSGDTVLRPESAGATGRPLHEVASLAAGDTRFAVLAIALYLPVVASVAITRAWRFTWSVRAAALVAVFGAALLAVERGAVDLRVAPSMLAVPIALGLALSAASIAGSIGSDVLARGFGWRQPVAVIANLAVVVGVIPALLTVGDGGWDTPDTTTASLLQAQLPADPDVGEYRALHVGDPRMLPVPGKTFRPGIAYAVTESGPLEFGDRFPVVSTRADDAVERALELIADGSTLRAGRLLAPLGIRYVVVVYTDGAESTSSDPVEPPAGLVPALENQLDLGAVYGPPSLEIFVNEAWIPVGAYLTEASADASRIAGDENLAQLDLEGAPVLVGADEGVPEAIQQIEPGVVHVAVPYDERLRLDVDGRAVAGRPGFGVTTAFDVEVGGTARLSYERDSARGWWIAPQMTLFLVIVFIAAGARAPMVRRRQIAAHDETLIDLDEATQAAFEAPEGVAGEALDPSGPVEFDNDEFDDDAEFDDDEFGEVQFGGADVDDDEFDDAEFGEVQFGGADVDDVEFGEPPAEQEDPA